LSFLVFVIISPVPGPRVIFVVRSSFIVSRFRFILVTVLVLGFVSGFVPMLVSSFRFRFRSHGFFIFTFRVLRFSSSFPFFVFRSLFHFRYWHSFRFSIRGRFLFLILLFLFLHNV